MKTAKSSDHPVAIPTTFKGIEFKSRLEAQTAFLFETFGIAWEYEPTSVMLSNGICYTPDFHLPNQRSVVECRGYDSEKGQKQIEGFVKALRADTLKYKSGHSVSRFFVIAGDHRSRVYRGWDDEDENHEGILLQRCCYCGEWSLGDFDNYGCGTSKCGVSPCCLSAVLSLTVEKGKLLLNGLGSEGWANENNRICSALPKIPK